MGPHTSHTQRPNMTTSSHCGLALQAHSQSTSQPFARNNLGERAVLTGVSSDLTGVHSELTG
eukprot:5950469-Amphidinium_carterae.1